MLPTHWPRWIVAPIGFALALASIGLGLILALAVQASAPHPQPTPTPPRLAYAAPLSGECTACHTDREKLKETLASEEEAQRLFIEPSQTESLHGRLGCVTCHQGTPDTQDIETAHTGLVADPSLYFHENCLLCHRDLPDEFPDDNLRAPHDQVVHGLAENLTCSDCHGAVGHGYDPVSGEVIISMAACLECHKERNLDVQSEDCNACHMEAPGWSPDMDCATCHVKVSYSESMQDPNLLAYAHAQEGLVCLDCHEEAELQQVHEGVVPGTTTSKEARFSNEFCFDCHVPNEHTSYPEIIERTEDYTVLGVKVNPHAYKVDPEALDPEGYKADPEAPDPHDTEQGELECNQCHKIHQESPSLTSCYQCHHDAIFLKCSVCHKE
jgi:hypothetical protein